MIKKIIIGIDPWLFKEDKNIAEGRWQSIEEFYNSFHGVKIKQSKIIKGFLCIKP